jgi:hypothetical protein
MQGDAPVAGFAIQAEAPVAGFAIQAEAPAARAIWFAPLSLTSGIVGDRGNRRSLYCALLRRDDEQSASCQSVVVVCGWDGY